MCICNAEKAVRIANPNTHCSGITNPAERMFVRYARSGSLAQCIINNLTVILLRSGGFAIHPLKVCAFVMQKKLFGLQILILIAAGLQIPPSGDYKGVVIINGKKKLMK